jgi:hypothetical protein
MLCILIIEGDSFYGHTAIMDSGPCHFTWVEEGIFDGEGVALLALGATTSGNDSLYNWSR